MSTYIKELKHPRTKKKQEALCYDDYFGQHQYGYFFRKDGGDMTLEILDSLFNNDNLSMYDIFTEEQMFGKFKLKVDNMKYIKLMRKWTPTPDAKFEKPISLLNKLKSSEFGNRSKRILIIEEIKKLLTKK